MTRGGKRQGAGRPKGTCKSADQKAKNHTFKLYDWEVSPVKDYIKSLRYKNSDNAEWPLRHLKWFLLMFIPKDTEKPH